MTAVPLMPWHLTTVSPWPLAASLLAGGMTSGMVVFIVYGNTTTLFLSGAILVVVASLWWRDINREASYQGVHTSVVETGMRYGMGLFIVSEVFFFLSFFWAYFHMSLSPVMELGLTWPPMGSAPANPLGVPLLNTVILLASGLSLTWCHHLILGGDLRGAKLTLAITVALGWYFILVQAGEYYDASFSIADSVFGSVFYVATGFHGMHVMVGLAMLTVTYFRLMSGVLSSGHHFGFEASAWYWHFVDVVWVGLYTSVYFWGVN